MEIRILEPTGKVPFWYNVLKWELRGHLPHLGIPDPLQIDLDTEDDQPNRVGQRHREGGSNLYWYGQSDRQNHPYMGRVHTDRGLLNPRHVSHLFATGVHRTRSESHSFLHRKP